MTIWTSSARLRRKVSRETHIPPLSVLNSRSDEATVVDVPRHFTDPAVLLAESPLFAAAWYAEMSGSDPSPIKAARHYLRRGAGQGLHPHPLFAPEHVVAMCPVLGEGVDPLVSYLDRQAFQVATHPLFDVKAYLAANPAALTHPGGPLAHYVQIGAREKLAPNAWYRPHPLEPAGVVDWVVAQQRERFTLRKRHPRPWTRKQPRLDEVDERPIGEPLVSVILVAGRRFEPLERTVRSVLAQEQPACEVLVATDGSIGDLADRLANLGSPTPLVVVPYQGPASAVGVDLAAARAVGSLLAWASPGDTWASGRLRLLQGLCVTDGHVAVADTLRLIRQDKPAVYACATIASGRPTSLATVDPSRLVLSRAAFEGLGGFDQSLLGAWETDFGFRLLRRHSVHQVSQVGATRDAEATHEADRLAEADRPLIEHERVSTWTDAHFNKHAVDWRSLADRRSAQRSVTVLVVADSGWRQALACVSRVQAAGPPAGGSLECVVVDDGSDRVTSQVLDSLEYRFPDVRVHHIPSSLGSALASNLPLADLSGEMVVLLDCEVRVQPGWLDPLVNALERPDVVGAQSLVMGPEAVIHTAGFAFPSGGGVPYHFLRGFPVEDAAGLDDVPMPALSRTAMAIRFADLVAVHGFDPLFRGGLEDVDLCLRLRAVRDGRLLVIPSSRVTRKSHRSAAVPMLNRRLLLDRWGASMPRDDTRLWASRGFDVAHYSVPASGHGDRRLATPAPVVSRPRIRIDEVTPRMRWALKVASPAGERCQLWGDTHFARRLAVALRDLGQEVVIDHREAFYRPTADLDDVVLVLRGLESFQPAYGQLNLAWVISHPEMLTRRELALYDRVVAASSSWARRMSRRWELRIDPLLQATDPGLFHPDRGRPDSGEPLLFVGGSRRQHRKIVMRSVEAGLPLSVYGSDWEGLIPQQLIKGQFIPNADLGASYASARLVLNDHWEDMRREGFLSNRLFDAVASGARVISDDVEGAQDIFESSVQVASDASALQRLVTSASLDHVFGDLEQRRSVADRVHREHSFAVRASRLLELALEVRHEQRLGASSGSTVGRRDLHRARSNVGNSQQHY